MTNTLFNECIEMIKGLIGHDYLYFDSAVQVKLTPHTPAFYAWGICVSPKDDLYIMDNDEQWHLFRQADQHAGLLAGSLYQRLSTMRTQYAKAS